MTATNLELSKGTLIAKRHFKVATEYLCAANLLMKQTPVLKMPLYFLYSHSLELILKAYINTIVEYSKHEHDLVKLARLCIKNNLKLPIETDNILRMIQSENGNHGFRYFNFQSTLIPDLAYYSTYVNDTMEVVKDQLCLLPVTLEEMTIVMKFEVSQPINK